MLKTSFIIVFTKFYFILKKLLSSLTDRYVSAH